MLHGIRMGTLKAGDRLVPEEIAAEIGMSRMPVREAFRRLATEGLVVIRPNRGAIVRGLTLPELKEVFEMRGVLEALAAATALEHMDSDDIVELERRLEAMERFDTHVSRWVTAHRDFHEFLCRLSASPRLVAQISALHSVIEPHMRLWLEHARKPMSSREDHVRIIEALKSRDRLAIEAVVREHILATIPALSELISPPPQA